MRNIILTLAAGATLLFGIATSTPLMSYVSTGYQAIKSKISRQVPIDFEIQRAKSLLASADEDIRANLELIARHEKEVVRLDERIELVERKNTGRNEELLTMKNSGATNGQILVKFTSLKRTTRELGNLAAIKDAKLQNLEALKSRLEDIMTSKEQLGIEIENLETRYTLAQTTKSNNSDLQPTNLDMVRELVDSLDARIAAEEQMITVDTDIDVEEIQNTSIEEVEKYLASINNQDQE